MVRWDSDCSPKRQWYCFAVHFWYIQFKKKKKTVTAGKYWIVHRDEMWPDRPKHQVVSSLKKTHISALSVLWRINLISNLSIFSTTTCPPASAAGWMYMKRSKYLHLAQILVCKCYALNLNPTEQWCSLSLCTNKPQTCISSVVLWGGGIYRKCKVSLRIQTFNS